MKKMVMTLMAGIVFFVFGVCFLLVGIIGLHSGSKVKAASEAYQMTEQTYECSIQDVERVLTSLVAEDVTVQTANTEKIQIAYYDDIENPRYFITNNEGNLKIARGKKTNNKVEYHLGILDMLGIFSFEEEHEENMPVVITVPTGYRGGYMLATVSGNVTMSQIDVADTLSGISVSGSFQMKLLDDIGNYDIMTQTLSGPNNLPKESISGKNKTIDLSTTSGNIQIDFI